MLQLVCVIPCNLVFRKHGYKMKAERQGGIGLGSEAMPMNLPLPRLKGDWILWKREYL